MYANKYIYTQAKITGSLASKVQGHRASRQDMAEYFQGGSIMKPLHFSYSFLSFKTDITGLSVKALWVRVLAAKPKDLSLIPQSNMLDRGNGLL